MQRSKFPAHKKKKLRGHFMSALYCGVHIYLYYALKFF